jgi:hypothetical protein
VRLFPQKSFVLDMTELMWPMLFCFLLLSGTELVRKRKSALPLLLLEMLVLRLFRCHIVRGFTLRDRVSNDLRSSAQLLSLLDEEESVSFRIVSSASRSQLRRLAANASSPGLRHSISLMWQRTQWSASAGHGPLRLPPKSSKTIFLGTHDLLSQIRAANCPDQFHQVPVSFLPGDLDLIYLSPRLA